MLFVLFPSTLVISLLTLSILLSSTNAANPGLGKSYSPFKVYSGSTFFNNFNFFTQADPQHGYVTYADHTNLAVVKADGAYLSVDSSTYLTDTNRNDYYNKNGVGRKSVRIEGIDSLDKGLIIADIPMIPSGACGAWPTFGTLGVPVTLSNAGAIDIIMGSNLQNGNWMQIFPGQSSSISAANSMTGVIAAADCSNGVNSGACTIVDTDPASFVNYQGGVWALQMSSDVINVWYWPYASVPSSALSDNPVVTSSWGSPRGSFGPSNTLNFNANFENQHIVFDTTFCGDFGDATWGTTSQPGTCAYMTGFSSCTTYVAHNPAAFVDTYWQINYVKMFTEQSNTTTSTTTSAVATTSSTLTTTTTSSTTPTTSSTTTKVSSSSTTSTTSTSSTAPTTMSSSTMTTTSSTTTMSTASTSSSTSTTSSTPTTTTTSTSSTTTRLSSTSSTSTKSSSSSLTTTTTSSNSVTSTTSTTSTSTTVETTTQTSSSTTSTTSSTSSAPRFVLEAAQSTTSSVSYTPTTTSSTPTTSLTSTTASTTSSSTSSKSTTVFSNPALASPNHCHARFQRRHKVLH